MAAARTDVRRLREGLLVLLVISAVVGWISTSALALGLCRAAARGDA